MGALRLARRAAPATITTRTAVADRDGRAEGRDACKQSEQQEQEDEWEQHTHWNRRSFLKAGAAGLAAFGPGIQLFGASAAAAAKVVVQYDWLMSNGQIGDVAAVANGYFKEAGLEVEFSPGGPNSATVPPVVSGAAQLGQFSETPQLYAARASGVPVKIIACGFRTGPYALTSKPAKPIRVVADLKGKRIGIQPTARFAIDAMLAKNEIDPSEVTIVNVGFDKAPLVRGDVDAIGGWITNTQALSVVGDDRIDLLLSRPRAWRPMPTSISPPTARSNRIPRRWRNSSARSPRAGAGSTPIPRRRSTKLVAAYPEIDSAGNRRRSTWC